MSMYAGLDVSDKTTHICVVDADGKVLRRDVVASDPDVLAKWLNRHCVALGRVVLETGTLSTFLSHGLVERGVAIECICARHAKGVPRRSQSGERDVSGHISKAGDPMLRKALYEAANVALSQVKRPFALQAWGRKIAEAKGPRRARTAVARKLATLLHSLWLNETEFRRA